MKVSPKRNAANVETPLLSLIEAGQYMRLGMSTLYERLNLFDSVVLGRRRFITRESCDRYLGVSGKVMVFVPSIRKGQELQAELKVFGYDLPFYHGQIQPPHMREMLLKRFTGELMPEVSQIICTMRSVWGWMFQMFALLSIINCPLRLKIICRNLGGQGEMASQA